MATTEFIDSIIQTLEKPLWGRWNLKERIRVSAGSGVFRIESKCMNRIETAILTIVPLTASKPYLTYEQQLAQIADVKALAEQQSELMFRLRGCPNIVTYQDEDLRKIVINGQFEGYAYLIRSETLDRIAERIRRQRFICNEKNVLRLAIELTQALLYAHRLGITHHQIQPDKILLTFDNTAKLSGFQAKEHTLPLTFSDSGILYAAPETVKNHIVGFTPQADIFSLGICLYQFMNRMNLPFESQHDVKTALKRRMDGEPLPDLVNASDSFNRIILKACAYVPEERYQTAESLLRDLMFPEKAEFVQSVHTHTHEETSACQEAEESHDAQNSENVSEPAIPVHPMNATSYVKEQSSAEEKRPEITVKPTADAYTGIQPVLNIHQSGFHTDFSFQLSAEDTAQAEGTDQAEFVIQSGTLIRYKGNRKNVIVPHDVTVIGSGAFENCMSIRKLILPQGVMCIEENAFANCSALENVRFPASLRMIHNKAFLNCSSLRSVELHGVLSQIGISAFSGCSSLETVLLDCPIEDIGFDAFSGCHVLKQIDVSSYSYSYKSVDGVLFDYECKYLIKYPSGREAAYYIIQDTVYAIEDGAFYGCSSIERVKLSVNTKKIGASAFRDCIRLREVIFSESLETIKASAFQGCVSLTSVTLPAWTTYIGAYAFSHCEKLETVCLPPKMTELCMGVFEYCKSLSFLRLPGSIVTIGEKAFMGSGLTEMFVPYSISKIEKYSFAGCMDLQCVFLSNRITHVSHEAFDECNREMIIYGITGTLPEKFAHRARIRFEPLFTLVSAGKNCELRRYDGKFSYAVTPPEVNVISDGAFQGCKTIRFLELSSGVGAIGKEAFEGCENLECVVLTNLVICIGENAFYGCNALNNIQIVDLSQQFPAKTQRKIHRNFFNVLLNIQKKTAEEYAKRFNLHNGWN